MFAALRLFALISSATSFGIPDQEKICFEKEIVNFLQYNFHPL